MALRGLTECERSTRRLRPAWDQQRCALQLQPTELVLGSRKPDAMDCNRCVSQHALFSEAQAEPYIGTLSGNMALYGWKRCGFVPGFQSIYGGYTTMSGIMGWPCVFPCHDTVVRRVLTVEFS